ncbi:signal peptidase I [Tenacibaculum tangerinum]|uniref:Signal peptidase I n=1 Tax=Tenacibaculum tangerinum TaxID=3038772 RepID=A0ABY8KYN8_9FLAO|nr:signal peptidase I [Tenacibaculum tangerinum]WGH74125.1 signal peptidase I [Tenacibaculum tangerinum]
MKKLLFFIGIISILLFYFWSKLIVASILFILILDSFTVKILVSKLEKILPKNIWKIISYGYIIMLPVLFAIFFRTFFFDIYYVPSSSMERTLFPNDYVIINKISYGVKLPKHPRNIPVIGSFFTPPKNEYNIYQSLKPFKRLKREDIVVFKAVDNSDKFLIKRIIGMPGDTIELRESKVFINSRALKEKESYSYNFLLKNKIKNLLIKNYSNKEYRKLPFNEKNRYKKNVIEKPNFNYFLFPASKQDNWTRDNYGKLIIPKKGMKISLTDENIGIYKSVVLKFENINLQELENQYYTFKNDYYFMMGDNRHNSIDSRSFGFVPESYIQGKMIKVFSRKRLFSF